MAEDGKRRGQRDNRRGTRANDRQAEARRHTEDVEARLAAEIERSCKGLRRVDGTPKPAAEGVVPQVTVVAQDTVSAIMERGRGVANLCDLAVLDFASFTFPGGGYDRGTMAQEQSLCAESFLYSVLRRQGDWYAENRRRNINCELYRNRALVVPKVRFERERYHSYADVLVVAAPDARRARGDYRIDETTLERAMADRIRFALSVADTLGHEKLVLGAFGCGVFGWDASLVAELFRAELATGTHIAREVTFAVMQGRRDDNLERFQHAFATFPECNDAPYVRPEAPAPTPRPKRREESEDEGEQDWRKYL